MMKFLAMVWLECLRNFWSNLRWCAHRKDTTKEIPTVNADNLNSTLREVYNNFEWTMDDWTQLFDSMRPAPYVYNLYFGAENTKTDFKDDCDGFHTVIYHILKNNGYDVALITVATKPIKNSHTMCAIKEKIEEQLKLDDTYPPKDGRFKLLRQNVYDFLKGNKLIYRLKHDQLLDILDRVLELTHFKSALCQQKKDSHRKRNPGHFHKARHNIP